MRIMSLDVGSQTIGVAVSDLFGWTAQGLETIRHTTREKDFERLRQLTDEYKVEEFVLGMPLNMMVRRACVLSGRRNSLLSLRLRSPIFLITSGMNV